MRVMVIIALLMLISFFGCAMHDHSVRIDTDGTSSNAIGQYSDNRSDLYGPRNLGEGNPISFARSIAIINYSKRLRNITYNEMGGIVGFDFDGAPYAKGSVPQKFQSQHSLPPSYGYQPIQ